MQKTVFYIYLNIQLSFRFFFVSSVNSWYKEGSIGGPLQATLKKGGAKDMRSTAILTIIPRKEDDDAKYKCVVHNRAMAEGESLETSVTLNVNCKYLL